MRAPPKPSPIIEPVLRSNLFSAQDIFELSKTIEPSFEYARAQAMVLELEGNFSRSLGMGDEQVNSQALEAFYTRMANDIRRLATTLGLPTDPYKIASQFPSGALLVQENGEATNIPDGLAWLFEASFMAVFGSKAFTSLIANSLKNPEDPGDWYSGESAIDWAFEEAVIESQNAANAQRPAFETALAEQKIPFSLVAPKILENSLTHMADHKTNVIDALEFAVAQALGCGDHTYGFRVERRLNFCNAQISSLPFLLALALGAVDDALRSAKDRPKYENWDRRFRNGLFYELVSTHYDFFGRHPQVRDRDNLPEGSGVNWTRGVLKKAADNIDVALVKLQPDPHGWRKGAIYLVKQASRLAAETIADRLEVAIKAHKSEHPAPKRS